MTHTLGDTRAHYWKTLGMARAVGVDLQEAIAQDRFSVEDFSKLVTSCRNCPEPENCGAWLEDKWSHDAEPPGFCPNAALWDRLKEA